MKNREIVKAVGLLMFALCFVRACSRWERLSREDLPAIAIGTLVIGLGTWYGLRQQAKTEAPGREEGL